MAWSEKEMKTTGRHVVLGNISVGNLDNKVVQLIGSEKFKCTRKVAKSSDTSIIIYPETFGDVSGFPTKKEGQQNITTQQILEYINSDINWSTNDVSLWQSIARKIKDSFGSVFFKNAKNVKEILT